MKLLAHAVEKPWGRTDLPAIFGGASERPIGEIWFEHPEARDAALLVKYIFTNEKLSIQVHPDDHQARDRDLSGGKSECWYILDAEKGATLGLGLRSPVSANDLRNAALDGSIENLMDWRPVKPGDFFYVPAGTIHAIGAGITLLEVQQNSDVTYRLYDYGRPRELHLDDGIAVSRPEMYPPSNGRQAGGATDVVLLDQAHFSLVRVSAKAGVPSFLSARQKWVMPLEGRVTADGESAVAGECLLLEPGRAISLTDLTVALIGVQGSLENQGT